LGFVDHDGAVERGEGERRLAESGVVPRILEIEDVRIGYVDELPCERRLARLARPGEDDDRGTLQCILEPGPSELAFEQYQEILTSNVRISRAAIVRGRAASPRGLTRRPYRGISALIGYFVDVSAIPVIPPS